MPRTTASDTDKMPSGIPYIIGNEAAERFSFYGMKAALVIFMTQYLHLMGNTAGDPMSSARANENVHWFVLAIYITPLMGAFLSDRYWGKYKTIIILSLVYCAGHAALAFMGFAGPAVWWLLAGLGLIAIGGGGIKPCVSAHVGDQFGINNQHLLTRVFNWFYFSINFGAVLSNIFIPWTLKWYGPHWAFGVPGVLMAIATLLFWMGRNQFVHIPPAGKTFTEEILSAEGLKTIGKVCSIFLFIPIFWALFDQTASSWVFQAIDMDRELFGIEILPSQVQAANPFLILILIPIFTYLIYPAIDKVWKLTALRKIGIGLFVTAIAFAISAIIQEWIDAGQRPNISWQILAYILLTSAEIMVSIVCLEFAYTQAPKSMKSMIMSIFLVTVALGNGITAAINNYIQTPSPLSNESKEAYALIKEGSPETSSHHSSWLQNSYPGYDQKLGTEDDITTHFTDKAVIQKRDVPSERKLLAAANVIELFTLTQNNRVLPSTEKGTDYLKGSTDMWGNPLKYRLMNGNSFRISSMGPDQEELTEWDTAILVTLKEKSEDTNNTEQRFTWLENRKKELGVSDSGTHSYFNDPNFSREFVAGGLYKLEGASYFWFFTYLMLGSAVLFIPVSMLYKECNAD
jgi:POT family proton-dependent oligopeptide transporter